MAVPPPRDGRQPLLRPRDPAQPRRVRRPVPRRRRARGSSRTPSTSSPSPRACATSSASASPDSARSPLKALTAAAVIGTRVRPGAAGRGHRRSTRTTCSTTSRPRSAPGSWPRCPAATSGSDSCTPSPAPRSPPISATDVSAGCTARSPRPSRRHAATTPATGSASSPPTGWRPPPRSTRRRRSTTRASPASRPCAALAPDEAIRWFTMALEHLDLADDPDDPIRAELLVELGTAQQHVGDPAYRQTLLDAGALARRDRRHRPHGGRRAGQQPGHVQQARGVRRRARRRARGRTRRHRRGALGRAGAAAGHAVLRARVRLTVRGTGRPDRRGDRHRPRGRRPVGAGLGPQPIAHDVGGPPHPRAAHPTRGREPGHRPRARRRHPGVLGAMWPVPDRDGPWRHRRGPGSPRSRHRLGGGDRAAVLPLGRRQPGLLHPVRHRRAGQTRGDGQRDVRPGRGGR